MFITQIRGHSHNLQTAKKYTENMIQRATLFQQKVYTVDNNWKASFSFQGNTRCCRAQQSSRQMKMTLDTACKVIHDIK